MNAILITGKIGNIVLTSLIRASCGGKMFPINSGGSSILGRSLTCPEDYI
jgi:hypothetical protein